MRWITMLALLAGVALPAAASAAPATRVGGDYVYQGAIDLGAPGSWDYGSFDLASGRLLIGHRDRIDAVDPATGKVVGSVTGLNEAHGAAADDAIGRGFATSGGDGVLREFSLTDFSIVKDIPIAPDVDGIVFDPGTGQVLVAVGDGKQLVIVDAKSATIADKVDLPGAPEFVAADGAGKAFVNLASTGQLAKVDIASGKLDAVWPLDGCKSPHGLGYDHHTHRLFAGCANGVVVAVDPANGKLLATLTAAPFNDAILIDETRGRVFCPNGFGTLTVIQEGPGDSYRVERTVPTFLGARSGALDPHTGTLYLTFGNSQIKTGPRDPAGLTFSFAGAKVAIFTPND